MKYTVRPEISIFRQRRVSDKTPPMKPGKKALRACFKCGCYEPLAGMTDLCCRVTTGQDCQFDRKDEGEPSRQTKRGGEHPKGLEMRRVHTFLRDRSHGGRECFPDELRAGCDPRSQGKMRILARTLETPLHLIRDRETQQFLQWTAALRAWCARTRKANKENQRQLSQEQIEAIPMGTRMAMRMLRRTVYGNWKRCRARAAIATSEPKRRKQQLPLPTTPP